MKNIFYILLVIVFVVISIAITVYYNLEWFYNLIIIGILGIIILLFFLIKRYINRRRNKTFIKRIISEDKDILYINQEFEIKNSIEELFNMGLSILNNSNLKIVHKEPKYSIPWFCFIGDENSGKTTLLKNSKLTSSLTDVNADAKTKYFNWCFFEELAVLDISSKYIQNDNDIRIEKEWETILELISKNRIKEPLNGIIVTVDVDLIINEEIDTLVNKALFIRKRINQLMKIVHANFPIYIMVTKIDKLMGATEILNSLDNEIRNNSFGYVNDNFEFGSNDNFELQLLKIVEKIKKKIEVLVINSVLNEKEKTVNSIQFLNEFDRLNEKLKIYISVIFRKSQYQYTPKFRGLYYSCAKLGNQINSNFQQNFLPQIQLVDDSKNSKDYFIKNFLVKNLLEDRYVFEYFDEHINLNKIIKNIWIWIISLIFVTSVILIFTSFKENEKILIETQKNIFLINLGELDNNINQFYQFHLNLKLLENNYQDSLYKNIIFSQSETTYKYLKTTFTNNFNQNILENINKNLNQILYSKKINNNDYEIIMNYLVLNINLNKTLLSKNKISFSETEKSEIENFLILLNINNIEIVNKYIISYEAYLNWIDEKELQRIEINLQNQLKYFIDLDKGNFDWLMKKELTNTEPITFKDFLFYQNGLLFKETSSDSYILGAYTKEGKKQIEKNIQIISNAINIEFSADKFWKMYYKKYVESWKNFLINFPNMLNRNVQYINDPMIILMITSEENPFNRLIRIASEELKELPEEYRENWINELLVLKDYIDLSESNRNDDKTKETIGNKIKKELLNSGSKIN